MINELLLDISCRKGYYLFVQMAHGKDVNQ